MRLIDADALLEHLENCLQNSRPLSNLYDLSEIVRYVKSMPTIAASPWYRVEEPPEPHKDVLVTGMEAINNSRVYKVMVNDNGTWRPTDYAQSIRWDYWMPIEPRKVMVKEDA